MRSAIGHDLAVSTFDFLQSQDRIEIDKPQSTIGNWQLAMKIVRIIARLNVGGPAKHVVWLTGGLQNAESQTVLVAGSVPPGEDDMGYFATEHGVFPVFVPEMSREISLKDLLTIWKLYRLLLRERPDVVHTHTAKAGTAGRVAGLLYRWSTPTALIGRRRRCRFVHTYHGHIFHSYYGPLKTRLFLLIERGLARLITDRIVVVSEQQRREILETFRVGRASQFVVIPLGLDLTTFANWKERRRLFRDELSVAADQILVGIVGRLSEIKNHELFLEAASLFRAAEPEVARRVKFVVIGDGALRERLTAQTSALKLNEVVLFTGSRKDPENFYPALDVVALSSRNEGTPLTLIEAMANGRAVIATAVGGVVDLLGEITSWDAGGHFGICERGIGVTPDNARAFASGLGRLVADAQLRAEMGQRGQRFVEGRHSKERLLDDMRGLYLELLQPNAVTVAARSTKHSLESRV